MDDYRRESVGCHSHHAEGFATFQAAPRLTLSAPSTATARKSLAPKRKNIKLHAFATPVCGKFVTLGLDAPLQ
jgi:hypothetical protein